MPTPPTISETTTARVIGGNPYGSRTASDWTTWAKVRCTLIEGYNSWSKGNNSLKIDDGYHPDDSYLLRVIQWPQTIPWVDSGSAAHTQYEGPILGFTDNGGVSGTTSYIAVGSYDWDGNDTLNPLYTSANNNLDENDAANCYTGQIVNGTYATTAEWTDAAAAPPALGTDIGTVAFTGYVSITGFTAF